MQLTPEQIIKISFMRKRYMAAYEKWTMYPKNFDVLIEVLNDLGKVKLECLHLLMDAAKRKGIHVENVDDTHRLFSCWKVNHNEARLIKLHKLIESTLYNKQCLAHQEKCIRSQPCIVDISVNIALLTQGHTLTLIHANAIQPVLNYVIAFKCGSIMVMDDLEDHKELSAYRNEFNASIHASSLRPHQELIANANR